MSQADKRLATDVTLQATNTAIGATNTALGNLAKNSTLQSTNTALGALGKDETLQAIAEILASVKSVNGKYGVVVLDSGDILIAKNTTGSKTIKQVLNELVAAIAATPLSFSATQTETGDYKLAVTQGTPS